MNRVVSRGSLRGVARITLGNNGLDPRWGQGTADVGERMELLLQGHVVVEPVEKGDGGRLHSNFDQGLRSEEVVPVEPGAGRMRELRPGADSSLKGLS
jgi:hypothetical protein